MIQSVNRVQNLPVRSVHKSIQTFLNHKGKKSTHTQKAYESDIKMFFSFMRGKDLSDLTENDLNFTQEEVIEYQDWLMELEGKNNKRKYKNTSINRKINSLRSLYSYLLKNKYDVDAYAFDIDELPEHDSEVIGVLTVEEAKQLVELAKNLPNGLEKSLLIELAYKTSIRLGAILSLKLDNFKKHDDEIWIIEVIDKGNKKDKKPISNEFYNRLINTLNRQKEERLFQMSRTTINDAISEICKQMNITKDRNISFHSLKKVAINWILEETGDIALALIQGNHSNHKVMLDHYVEMNKNYSEYAGIAMDNEIDINEIEKYSKECLISAIRKLDKKSIKSLLKELSK